MYWSLLGVKGLTFPVQTGVSDYVRRYGDAVVSTVEF